MDDFDAPILYHHDETMPPVEPGIFGFSRRSLIAGGGALAISAFLAACGSSSKSSSTTTPAAGPTTAAGATTTAGAAPGASTTAAARTEAKVETITIGVPSLQEAFVDPHWAVGGLIFPLMWAIAEFLYTPNQENKYVPNLATGFDLSADKLTWTFKLRSGVKMHDGSAFTANDVKTAVDRVVKDATMTHLANFKSFVTGATVIDPLTVAVVTNKPFATLVVDMVPPIATDYYNTVGDAKFKTNPVCSGPWKFVSQELNANVKYERHEEYFDPARKPNWKKLVYAIVPDESSRVAGIQTGTLDIAYGLTGTTADSLKSDSKVTINENKGTGLGYCMMYDNNFPDVPSPLKDVNVRKALLMAIDRDSIAKTLYKGYANTPTSNVPTVTPGFNPDTKAVPYDPAGAKKLLADAGQTNLSFALNTYSATSTVPDIQKLAETIIAFWSAIGVKATLSASEAATYLPQFRNKQLKGACMIAGPTSFYVEPTRLTAQSFFWSKAPYTTIVGDAKVDDLVAQLNGELDADKRAVLGKQLGDYLDQQMYGLPIILVSSLVATGPNIASLGFVKGNPYAGPTSWVIAK
ncbi:MAG: peptide/nickel transport system substrate-binding protein [Acidimicrobiaceae bacterium]|jgi:peptide/nickel transport system substrate-binding protein|nr:peptide/nickel transport system substrate-binding protein [Acidimicrobiaceae bacterium]